jgi:putative ABC transport system ATP-binding protein
VVTHDSRVYGFGDRIITMSDGRIEKVELKDRGPGGRFSPRPEQE